MLWYQSIVKQSCKTRKKFDFPEFLHEDRSANDEQNEGYEGIYCPTFEEDKQENNLKLFHNQLNDFTRKKYSFY